MLQFYGVILVLDSKLLIINSLPLISNIKLSKIYKKLLTIDS